MSYELTVLAIREECINCILRSACEESHIELTREEKTIVVLQGPMV